MYGNVTSLLGTPGLHSPMLDLDSDTRPLVLGHLSQTASLKRGSSFQSGRDDSKYLSLLLLCLLNLHLYNFKHFCLECPSKIRNFPCVAAAKYYQPSQVNVYSTYIVKVYFNFSCGWLLKNMLQKIFCEKFFKMTFVIKVISIVSTEKHLLYAF